MNEKVKYWLSMANYDYDTANVMLKGRRYLYVGFMCHQVLEKSLKALYVVRKNTNPPYTHNLSYLAKESEIYDELDEKQKDFLDIVDPLNIEARYPSYKEKLFKTLNLNNCRRILKQTGDLFLWIKKRL